MIMSTLFVGGLLFLSKTLALEEEQQQHEQSRGLTSIFHNGVDGYGELACNANASPKINTDECLGGATALSTLLGDATTVSSQVTIPCGTCYEVDYTDGETITLEAGLNVLGRLHFPSTANMVLSTTSVVVQGMWSMTTPDVGNTVKISLYGTEDVYVYPHDQCCTSSTTGTSTTCDNECTHKTNLESKPFAVVGGQLDIRAIDTDCPSWTTLKRSDQASKTFAVDSKFASCLAAGDELVVAGDEKMNVGHKRYTVASVSGESVVVQEGISKVYATEAGPGEPMFATEVAKLTRRVLFEGQEDIDNIGAHSIIFHTPDVVQTIQGVSFKGFGQGGKLGRYPIHFHKSHDTRSLVSKNVIRDSHQRCVFIHDTNYVTIDNNVAYNTRGHCYATETGSEVNNVFLNNLAVASHKLTITGNGQSDDPAKIGTGAASGAAAFWIRNMMNTFVGNRVGGCADAGFWLEMKDKKGNQLNEDSFRDNVAHGCFFGLITYKHGWLPSQPAHVKNMKVYKNRDGFKMHFTGNIKFTNFVAADDHIYRYGFANQGVDFEDSLFIGVSDDARIRLKRDCPYHNEGIRASFNTLVGGAHRQIHFKNVEFRNYNCNSRAITWYFDDRFSNKNMGDPLKATNVTFTGSTLESNQPALNCGSPNSQNWFMEDAEGTLGPDDKGPGFIVKDNAQMKAFLNNNNCETLSYSSCTAMCEGVCLRLVHIEPVGAGPFHSLTLTDEATQTSFTWTLDTHGESDGRAVLVVPKATYKGEFKDADGNLMIPSKVNIKTFGVPVCKDYVESTDFVFETSLCDGWWPQGSDKVILSHSGKTLTYSSYKSGDKFPWLRFDAGGTPTNTCVRGGTKLGVYFKAKLLNIDDDSPVDCIPGTNCPTGLFRARQDREDPPYDPYCNGWFKFPRSIVSWNKDEFNDVFSLFTVPDSCAGTNWRWFFLDLNMGSGYPANTVKMVVKDVKVMIDEGQYTSPPTLAPSASPSAEPSASPTANPTVSTSPTTLPTLSPMPTLKPTPAPTAKPTTLCDSFFPGSDKVILSHSGKTLTYSSYKSGSRFPAVRFDAGGTPTKTCVSGGTKLGVYFKAKLLNMTDNDSPVDCIPGTNCPSGLFRARQDPYCNGWSKFPRSIVSWKKDEFNDVFSLFTVPASCAGTGWRWFLLDINMGSGYPANTVKMIVKDVKVMIDEGQYTSPPTLAPSASPSAEPSASPTANPTVSTSPTASPTISPMPTLKPTPVPTPVPTTQCDLVFPNNAEKVLVDQGFESSKEGRWGGASTVQISPGASGDGKALAMTYSRPRNMLPAIRVKVHHRNECLRGGMQLNVSFKAKMLDMTNGDSPVDCTPGTDCPTARFRIRNDNCNGWYHIPKPTTAWNKNEYNTISTVWTVPTRCEGSTRWRWFYFDITHGKKYDGNTVKLLVDDVKISIKED